jgi:hypothetical protein
MPKMLQITVMVHDIAVHFKDDMNYYLSAVCKFACYEELGIYLKTDKITPKILKLNSAFLNLSCLPLLSRQSF